MVNSFIYSFDSLIDLHFRAGLRVAQLNRLRVLRAPSVSALADAFLADVLGVLRVRLDDDLIHAVRAGHREGPYLGRMIIADLFFVRIEAHTLCDALLALQASHVKRHLEADEEDAFVQLLDAVLPEVVLEAASPLECVQAYVFF